MTLRETLLRVISLRASTMPAAPLSKIYPQAHELVTCAASAEYYADEARAIERRKTAWDALRVARSARAKARRHLNFRHRWPDFPGGAA